MSLSRKSLREMNLEEEQIEAIIAMHGETVSALKEQIQQERSAVQAQKGVNEALQAEYDAYKQDVTRREDHRAREAAYGDLLRAEGVSEKRLPAVLRVTDLEAIPMEDGQFTDPEGLRAEIRSQWADFIPQTRTAGAVTPTPPSNTGGGMTREAVLAIRDRQARRAAIAQNLELFQ